MFGALPSPLRLEASDLSFENDLCWTNELVEIRRDNSGRTGGEAECEENWKNANSEWFFHFREWNGNV